MNQPIITLLALATVVLGNDATLAQTKWQYNRYAPDAEVVANLEEQWVAALLKRDTATLQSLRAEDFTLIAPNGRICRRPTELSLLLPQDFKLDSFVLQDGNVRVYTGGVIVTGTVAVKGTAKDTGISGQYRFTDVYEPRGNSWQAVFSQWTKVEEKGTAKETDRASKS